MKKSAIFLLIFFLMPLVSAQSTLDQAKEFLPDVNFDNVGLVIAIFFIIVILLIGLGVGTYYLIIWLKFNRQIVILEDVKGSDDLEPVGKDKAMLVKVGDGGTEVLYLRKRKVYRGAYGKRMDKNKYYFAIGPDGFWYNVTLGSLDQGMQKVKIKPTAVNMRYQNESLQELIKKRYSTGEFWKKYGFFIFGLVFFILQSVLLYLSYREYTSAAPNFVQAADALRDAADYFRQAVGGLDSLKATGGISPA